LWESGRRGSFGDAAFFHYKIYNFSGATESFKGMVYSDLFYAGSTFVVGFTITTVVFSECSYL
jgi:hypothetical protein